MRHWLLTWTTYGSWLPGDERGSITAVRPHFASGPRIHQNLPGTPYAETMPGLRAAAVERMHGPPILLGSEQAEALLKQFRETAGHRGWDLDAVAVMANHVHLVITVDGDPEPSMLLRDFKSYGSRALNLRWGKPVNGTRWTDGGSKRKLPDEDARQAAIAYLKNQEYPLIIWSADHPAA